MVYLLSSATRTRSETFFAYQGADGDGAPSFASMMLAAGVCLSLMAQIAEQIDYLRFMPPRTDGELAAVGGRAVILAGPGWVIFGAHQADRRAVRGGLHHRQRRRMRPRPPTSRCTSSSRSTESFLPGWAAMTLAVFLVVISQIKINVTNAYSGSLAWTNSFTRRHQALPGPAGLRRLQRVGRAAADGS